MTHVTEKVLPAFFEPKTVAIIGASTNPSKVGYTILSNLQRAGYTGTIVPVNPGADSILGVKCYKSLEDFHGTIDQSVIVVPRKSVMDSVRSSIAKGVKAITVITAGFKEQDHEGAELEKEMVALCHKAGVDLLGPNCLGHLNTSFNMDLSFGNKWPQKGNISFISQSGALCCAVLDHAAKRKIGLSKLISVGNKAGLGENDLLGALANDPDTSVIVAYLEGITHGKQFVEIATDVSEKKPIIMFKSGVTKSGSKAASSHTGSLAGADISYETAFNKSGIIRVSTYEEMFDIAQAFEYLPLPKGRRVAVITNAGGPGIMTTDAIELSGMSMAELTPETTAALKAFLPDAASVKNPVDVLGDADPSRYAKALEIVQKDPNVDSIVVLLTPQSVTKSLPTAEVLCNVTDRQKPIVACFLGGEDVGPARKHLHKNRLPDYASPEKAVNTIRAMVKYVEWKNRDKDGYEHVKGDKAKVSEIIAKYRASGMVQINEPDAKQILSAYGVAIGKGALVHSAEEAAEKAEKIGYPIVMKIVSPDIIHKSDVGGVTLFLKSKEEVSAAYTAMLKKIMASCPAASITGIYIEKMAGSGSKECIVGITRDPQFGPMVMFGLGGIFVELLKDVKFALAPLSKHDALDMIKSIKMYPLLNGYRGQAKVDIDAIAEVIIRVGHLAADFPEIAELDINPVMAFADGASTVAADARMTLAKK